MAARKKRPMGGVIFIIIPRPANREHFMGPGGTMLPGHPDFPSTDKGKTKAGKAAHKRALASRRARNKRKSRKTRKRSVIPLKALRKKTS